MAHYVAIEAGHGGFGVTPGKRTPAGEYEWNFNNTVAVACIAKLEANGIKVLRTDDHTGRTDVPLKTRTDKANAAGVDVLVSIHHNANTGVWGNWSGTETYTYNKSVPKSEALAREVHKRIVSAYGLHDRGMKKANFHMLRETDMPAILTEGGYMDSKIDIKKMRDDKVLMAAGEAIAEGVMAYLGVEPKKEAPKAVAPSGQIYRVRKTWADEKSQVGAYRNLDTAKDVAEKNKYYRVFDEKGVIVWQPEYDKDEKVAKPAPKPKPAPAPKPKHSIAKPTLKMNSKGSQVKLLQENLNDAHFKLKGRVDGAFGPDTLQALKRFQLIHCHPADGVYGSKTAAAMNKVLN